MPFDSTWHMSALGASAAIPSDFKRLAGKFLKPRTNTMANVMSLRCILMGLPLFIWKKTKKVSFRPPKDGPRGMGAG